MSTLNSCSTGEFIDVVVAGGGTIETGLNAITFVFDFREGEINFGSNPRYIETSNVWNISSQNDWKLHRMQPPSLVRRWGQIFG